MIKEVKTIVPATAEKTVVTYKSICDDCGTIGAFNKCDECGADLCTKCRKYHPINDGDYTAWICGSCLDVFAAHEDHIAEVNKELDDAYDARRAECINRRKNLNNEVTQTT